MRFPPAGPTPPVVRSAIDVRNNLILPVYASTFLPVPYPGWRSLAASDEVFNLDTP